MNQENVVLSEDAVRRALAELESLRRLRTTLEGVEMMLGLPAEQPEAFDLGSLQITVKAAHKMLAAALKKT